MSLFLQFIWPNIYFKNVYSKYDKNYNMYDNKIYLNPIIAMIIIVNISTVMQMMSIIKQTFVCLILLISIIIIFKFNSSKSKEFYSFSIEFNYKKFM